MDANKGEWGRVAGLCLILILLLAVPAAASSLRSLTGEGERRPEIDVSGRVAQGSQEFPTPMLREQEAGPATDSGGLLAFECLGTVSRASIDNNFARLMQQAREQCGNRAESRH